MRLAWAIDLWAEHELEVGTPLPAEARARAHEPHALDALRAGSLVREDDVVVEESSDARGLRGQAWCRTPWARQVLDGAGAFVGPWPDFEAVRRANTTALRVQLPDHGLKRWWITGEDQLVARLERGAHLVRRAYGFAGKGRRRMGPVLTGADHAWLRGALEVGVLVEPWVEVREDWSIHGWLGRDGSVTLGAPVRQEVRNGAWRGGVQMPGADVAGELVDSALACARVLGGLRYFGPFGIDGIVYVERGRRKAAWCRDLNARLTMAWALGMGALARPLLDEDP